MSTTFIRPEEITHDQLDKLLALGWFRMGQMIFTCHFLYLDSGLYSPLWLRLSLKEYKYSKSLRKINRVNQERFTVSVQKAVIDEEKNELFDRHKVRFKGYRSDSLEEVLLGQSELDIDLNPIFKNIYSTYEVTVYDGSKMVACSFFDVGKTSATSIMGIFDPAYHKFSLGIYTMLVEVEFAIETGRELYYPGYVVPDYPSFDYKLRLGTMQFFHARSRSWKSYTDLKKEDVPLAKLQIVLKKLQKKLAKKDITTKILQYPLFDKVSYSGEDAYVSAPLILSLKSNNSHHLLIEYDVLKGIYRLVLCESMEPSRFMTFFDFMDPFELGQTCMDYLIIEKCLSETMSADTVVIFTTLIQNMSISKIAKDVPPSGSSIK